MPVLSITSWTAPCRAPPSEVKSFWYSIRTTAVRFGSNDTRGPPSMREGLRLRRLFAARLLARREEGGGGDPSVEVRPARAVRERSLDAVEAPQVPAEVVHEVHERGLARAWDDRAAVL